MTTYVTEIVKFEDGKYGIRRYQKTFSNFQKSMSFMTWFHQDIGGISNNIGLKIAKVILKK